MNNKLTFNEKTYEFEYKKLYGYETINIRINGELNEDYHLETGTEDGYKSVKKIWNLYYKNFVTSIAVFNINDLSEIVKIINYIINNEKNK